MPKRKLRHRQALSEPEKVIQAIQGVAAAGIILHKVVRPHLSKWREKRRLRKEVKKK